jgi:small-conductance mechanosensitive channel
MAIDKAFRVAGIEIAFPQRDLHLRSVPEHWKPPSDGTK